jgi:RimJ/RimL family protein N-acetyltransferase
MNFQLSTARLLLRPFLPDDAEELYALNADPQVLQFTGDLPFRDVKAAATFVEQYDVYTRYGMGRWAVIAKDSNLFLGWCGLKYSPDEEEYDLGFRFHRKYWNQGFATESSRACLDWGFKVRKLDTIVGRTMLANTGSVRVLEKVGMLWSKPFEMEGQPAGIWAIRNPHL